MGFNEISIVGAACRLPGAENEKAFAEILNQGRFTVTSAPRDRWNHGRLYHPGKNAPGAAYTFAGGFIDNPYDFDISVFGMSPREAEQVDPQQRLVAELVWEALENARIRPEDIAGKEVGVYVGVSSLDHSSLFLADPAAIETHFMTGNTLSIVANRISYLFDLKGPSYVVDTACSSSLVAVDRAIADLQSGRTDMAIVGGVNMLLSPASYVGFSRAQMLSPTGACRPFSGDADGYVRSEGGVIFVLQRVEDAAAGATRATLLGSAVSSDGRTSGIALPGIDGQRSMLERVYDTVGVAPEKLSFIEAHGTGTVVGDPIEATALGEVLGVNRAKPLPIGSVKSNIGHLEPASGVAGMMKALIAMEQRILPRTLHLDTLNPHVDFDKLNLAPAVAPVTLGDGELFCGVSSFGFGGTNAHVVMRGGEAQTVDTSVSGSADDAQSAVLTISAQSQDALKALAGSYADLLDAGTDPVALSGAAASGRANLRRRISVPAGSARQASEALRAFADGKNVAAGHVAVETGSALAQPPSLCFVFNGNGAQWVGMGVDAYRSDAAFRTGFDAANVALMAEGTENLSDLLGDPELDKKLRSAAVAQPLIFAIQLGIVSALEQRDIRPAMVFGHSLGEIAAAYVAGAITLQQAAKLLVVRPRVLEKLRGKGAMAVVAAEYAKVEEMLADGPYEALSIAADNSSNSVTISGDSEALTEFCASARRQGVASRRVAEVEYPFHSPLLDSVEADFRAEMGAMESPVAKTPFYSTVDGDRLAAPLDLDYWWHNMRCPVRFREAVHAAARDGANMFIEIGPRSIVAANVSTEVREFGDAVRVIKTLEQRSAAVVTVSGEAPADPIQKIIARLAANGLSSAAQAGVRAGIDRSIALPAYPWQRRTLKCERTPGSIDLMGRTALHPLIGSRLVEDGWEWLHVLDTELVPYLADHVVGGEVLVPATAMVEMALAVARDVNPEALPAVEDFDVLLPMVLSRGEQLEIRVRYSPDSANCSIYSRPRLTNGMWVLHAQGRIAETRGVAVAPPSIEPAANEPSIMGSAIYRVAKRSDLDYGPKFRLVRSARQISDSTVVAEMTPAKNGAGVFAADQVLHPASLDAAMHGLFTLLEDDEAERPTTWLPVRFGRVRLWKQGAQVTRSIVEIVRDTPTLKTVDLTLEGPDGKIVAKVEKLLMRAVPAVRHDPRRTFGQMVAAPAGRRGAETMLARLTSVQGEIAIPDLPDTWHLLRAHLDAAMAQSLAALADEQGQIDPAVLLARVGDDAQAAVLMTSLLDEAVDSGIANVSEVDGNRRLSLVKRDIGVEPEAILAACLETAPEATVDVTLSALAGAALDDLFTRGEGWKPRSALIARHRADGLIIQTLRRFVGEMVQGAIDDGAQTPHVVLAASAIDPLLDAFGTLALTGKIRLSILPADETARDRAAFRIAHMRSVTVLDPSAKHAADADLAISCREGGRPVAAEEAELSGMLAPGGAMLAVTLSVDHLTLFQRGQQDTLTEAQSTDAAGDQPRALTRAAEIDGKFFTVEILAPDVARGAVPLLPQGLVVTGAFPALAKALAKFADPDGSDEAPIRAWLVDGDECESTQAIAQLVLEHRTMVIAAEAEKQKGPLWAVVRGSAAADALRSFQRVAQNEYGTLDLRIAEIAADCPTTIAAKHLISLFAHPGAEREWHVAEDGLRVARFERGLATLARTAKVDAAHLTFPQTGNLESFRWDEAERQSPDEGQVEIEVRAVGLNFRDVMLALGALGDDVLDGGLAGAVYGMECAGRVVAVGPGVRHLKVGDDVFGFAQDCFSSNVVTSASGLMKIPEGLPHEAAAGLPVAFVTAWHSLVEVARLKEGETVLVHGGAGGVGLAAIQIAKAIGAEVIATVSSPDKEAMARLFGAAHVYSSRSLEFADQIRDRHDGVDVVLNSLSGDAMREGLRVLQPRGRFVELGKRDYIANTLVALRPFRRNLSYFGVDLDQLLALDPGIAERGVGALVDGLGDGTYLPLPTNVFEAYGVSEAFRLMQASGHIGKIVVRPPALDTVEPAAVADYAPGKGAHLVVGGTRGFGLATALWLASRGAKTIFVASRSGEIDPAHAASVKALARKGVAVDALKLDVTDAVAVKEAVDMIVTRCGRLEGVWHTAVELNDGMIEGIEPETLEKSLRAKVDGAHNLHLATRDIKLDRFVVYSSVSALIGNPGQGAYAAANGFIEGLCRSRRQVGLPALAVEWGAITDTGLLADRADILDSLDRIAGFHGMTSGDALEHLSHILAVEKQLADPVVACAQFARGGAIRSLPVALSPAFSSIFDRSYFEGHAPGASLRDMIADKDEAEARQIVLSLLTHEVAAILRLSAQEVDPDSTIDSLGMDSLMALELRMALESKYSVELPVMAVTAVGNLRDLSRKVVAMVISPSDSHDAAETTGKGAETMPAAKAKLTNVEERLLHIHGGARDNPATGDATAEKSVGPAGAGRSDA